MSFYFFIGGAKNRYKMRVPFFLSFLHGIIICLSPFSSVYGGNDVLPQVESVTIFEHGMYKIDPKSVPVSVSVNGVTNQVQPISEAKLHSDTNQGLAIIGTCFGVRFVVKGQETNSVAQIVVVVRHPPFKGAQSELSFDEEVIPWLYMTDEEVGYMYRLDEDRECVPGDWKIEIWHAGKKYAEQGFVLEAPDKKKKLPASVPNGANLSPKPRP